jgi:hypothetical protein
MIESDEARGETLSASVEEQLQTKERLESEARADRRVDEQAMQRTEHRKAEEREEVARHLRDSGATPSDWARDRAAARRKGRDEALLRDWGGRGLPIAGVALALLGIVTGRKLLFAAGVPLILGVLLLRNRLPVR